MTPLSTTQLRQVWSPACVNAHGEAIEELWSGIDDWFVHYGYVPRPGVTSAVNCRAITGGTGKSIHSFYDRSRRYSFRSAAPGHPVVIPIAAAIDVNSDRNPYGTRLVTDMPRAMVDAIQAMRTRNGRPVAVWGGYFTPHHDAMHFQPGCAPADLMTGINPVTLPNQEDDDMGLSPEDKVWLDAKFRGFDNVASSTKTNIDTAATRILTALLDSNSGAIPQMHASLATMESRIRAELEALLNKLGVEIPK